MTDQPLMNTKGTDWFGTATGRAVYAFSPDVNEIDIEDIALSLAKQCRFAGHVRRDVWMYSVAQHSVLVSYACYPEHALLGLLHDAAEAYVQDLIRPVKHSLGPEYRRAEQLWELAIGARFGLGDQLAHLPPDVTYADEALLATERRDIIEHKGRPWNLRAEPLEQRIEPVGAEEAYKMFLERFDEIYPDDLKERPLIATPVRY
jgi:5'-deoxynucleotidase YfbR-like HD superfamily hydrolase